MQMVCRVCKDDETKATCPRCEHALCAMHVPWKPGLACLECETEWERAAWKRKIVLAPVALVGLLLGMSVLALLMVLMGDHMVGGPGMIVVGLGGPIALAIWLVRRVDRVTFRRKFMRATPSRLPRSQVVQR